MQAQVSSAGLPFASPALEGGSASTLPQAGFCASLKKIQTLPCDGHLTLAALRVGVGAQSTGDRRAVSA